MAVQVAEKFGSKLVLFNVYEPLIDRISSTDPASIPAVTMSERSQRVQGAPEYSLKFLMACKERVKSGKVFVEIELAEGEPVDEIVKKAKRSQFDLIVMGARGLSTLKKLLIGSVSEGVLKKASCPVLIVK